MDGPVLGACCIWGPRRVLCGDFKQRLFLCKLKENFFSLYYYFMQSSIKTRYERRNMKCNPESDSRTDRREAGTAQGLRSHLLHRVRSPQSLVSAWPRVQRGPFVRPTVVSSGLCVSAGVALGAWRALASDQEALRPRPASARLPRAAPVHPLCPRELSGLFPPEPAGSQLSHVPPVSGPPPFPGTWSP